MQMGGDVSLLLRHYLMAERGQGGAEALYVGTFSSHAWGKV